MQTSGSVIFLFPKDFFVSLQLEKIQSIFIEESRIYWFLLVNSKNQITLRIINKYCSNYVFGLYSKILLLILLGSPPPLHQNSKCVASSMMEAIDQPTNNQWHFLAIECQYHTIIQPIKIYVDAFSDKKKRRSIYFIFVDTLKGFNYDIFYLILQIHII